MIIDIVATAALLIGLLPEAVQSTPPPPLRLPETALAAEKYTFATETARFPADVRDALARQLSQKSLRMADADRRFAATDDISDPSLPGHRLIMAALGPEFIVVHFERGGVALTRWGLIFQRTPAGLNALWHGVMDRDYRDRAAFEQAIRTGAMWKPLPRP